MKLWDEELESYRDEARSLLSVLDGLFEASRDMPADPLERATMMRDAMAQLMGDQPSELAEDRTIPGPDGQIQVRMMLPDEPRAAYLHIHGGAWASGQPRLDDPGNELLARHHDLAVVSVHYRRPPESPYPAAPDDCQAAAEWLLDEGLAAFGVDRMLIGGESAGAHLALVTALRLRDRVGAIDRVAGLNLVFGAYDLTGTPSGFDNGGKPDLLQDKPRRGPGEAIEWFTPGMSDADRRDPDISPLYADLSGLPPTLLTVGTYDHLLDDSLFLGMRMAAAESPVELAVYPDSPHGFQLLGGPMSKAAERRIDDWIENILP